MRWAPAPLVALVALLAAARAHSGPEDLVGVRQRFLADGDATALAAALAREAGDPTRVEVVVARLASDPRAAPAESGRSGAAALGDLIAGLRRLDLAAAEAAAERVGSPPSGSPDDAWREVAPWLSALLRARRGQDEAAVTQCLAVPSLVSLGTGGAGGPAGLGLYRLTLVGAALPEEDRLLLVATVRAAVLEAGRRGPSDAVRGLAEAAVALDRASGGAVLILAARILRRGGDPRRAQDLLAGPGATRVASSATPAASALALERSVAALLAGDAARSAGALAGVRPAPHDEALLAALARGPRLATAVPPAPAAPPSVGEERREAWMVARLAALVGRPADLVDLAPVPAGSVTTRLSAALAARGLLVLPLAGDPAALGRVLDRGLPALVLVPAVREDVWRELPLLVVGRSRPDGLLLLEEPDAERADVLLASSVAKGRLLAVIPEARAAERAVLRGAPPTEDLGRVLEDAAALREVGDVEGALRRLGAYPGASPMREDALALTLQERAATAGDRMDAQDVRGAAEAAERALATPPRTAFELHVLGQGRGLARDVDGALAAFAEAERVEGPAPWIERSRFALFTAARRHAEALRVVDAAWRLAPRQEIVLYHRGVARLRLGDGDGARSDLRRALDRRPEARTVALDLAILELEARRPRVTLAVLDELVRRDAAAASLPTVRDARRAAERALLQEAPSVADLAPFAASPEPDTRRWLAFALAEHETPESEALLQRLLGDPAPPVRVTALRVYMRPWFRAKVDGQEALAGRVVTLLTSDPDPLVRGAAAALLSLVTRPFAEEALAARLAGSRRDAHPYPRSASAAALARHGGPSSREALVAALEDEDATVRRSAIEALFRIASTYHGFDPDAEAALRAPAVQRWRAWLSEPSGG